MERYLIETSKVDARMVHHEHAFSFGEKAGLLDEYGFLRNPQWVQELKTLDDVANERGAVIIAENQLIHKYMGADGTDAGILVLGWFDAPAPNNVKNQWKTMEQAKGDLDLQVKAVRERGNMAASEVLDCRW